MKEIASAIRWLAVAVFMHGCLSVGDHVIVRPEILIDKAAQ